MRRNVEVVSCDFCGEDIEGMPVTAKVRINEGQRDVPVRLYNQIFFNWGRTRYSFDVCPKCKDKITSEKFQLSTDFCLDRSFTGANG